MDVRLKRDSWEFEREVQSAETRLTSSHLIERADLLQIGRLGVLKALDGLDRRRKHSKQWLCRLAYFSARNAMVDALRRVHGRHTGSFKRRIAFVSMDAEPQDGDGDPSHTLYDFLLLPADDEHDRPPSTERLRLALSLVYRMTASQRAAVLALVECGSYGAAADALGCSRQYLSMEVMKVRRKALALARARGIAPARLSVRSEGVTGR